MADENKGADDQGTKPAGTGGKDWEAEAEKWKALARKHEDQAKANKADLEKLQASSDSTKSDMDKVMEKLAAMEERAAKAERQALIAEVAATKKLSPKLARRLAGDTREELLADADELLEEFKAAGTVSKNDNGKDDAGKDANAKDDQGQGDGEGRKSLPPSSTTAGRPKEKLTSGTVPDASGDADPAKLAEKILTDY